MIKVTLLKQLIGTVKEYGSRISVWLEMSWEQARS
jgi:hypothetical protein